MLLKFAIFLALNQISDTSSARILGIVPTPSYSHQIIFRPIWNELSKRGHELVILTTDPQEISWQKNFRQIDLSGAYSLWDISKYIKLSKQSVLKGIQEALNMLDKVEDYEMEHPEVQELINNKTEHFDLLIMEYLLPITAVFSKRFNCPFIGVVSMDALTRTHSDMGNPIHPVLYPEFYLSFAPPLSFAERFASVLHYVLMKMYEVYHRMFKTNAKMSRYFRDNTYPPLREISQNVSMVFINTNPAFSVIRPLVPATVQIGGAMHIGPPRQLPGDIKEFLDQAEYGAIYLSFGTNVKSDNVGESLKQVFINTFKDLPYKILWKFDEDLENIPSNVKIVSWLPQQDVLRHPNVVLFITQGGLQSIEEAIFNHIPLIVIPFLADQEGNGRLIKSKGIGLVLETEKLNTEALKIAIVEVAGNPKYKDAVAKTAKILTDQPMSGTEKAVWWSEYVIRHKGAQHLKGSSGKLPLYQYFFLDVIAALGVIIFVSTYLTYKFAKWIFSKTFRCGRSKLKLQ